jgi:uncharacterized protein YjbI with pentapeptide repeats
MTFLGKFRIAGPKPLGINDAGLLALLDDPDDPRGVFFAYQVGADKFQLRGATTGQLLFLSVAEAPNAWYQVLYWAGTSSYGTRFELGYLDRARGTASLNFEVDTHRVGLYATTSPNPNCRCMFDVMMGWREKQFGLTVVAPGLDTIQRTKSCAGADLGRVLEASVDLAGADLSGAIDGSGANLTGARLDGTLLSRAKLTGADLRGASLAGADFRGANLTNADLRGATLAGAEFRDLDDAHPTTLAGTNFSGNDVTGTKFPPPPICKTPSNPMKLAGATVDYSSLMLDWSNLDLSHTTIVGMPVDADGAPRLPGLKAVSSVLVGFDFHHANLKSAASPTNFTGAVLSGANFAGADCTRAIFNGATCGGGPERLAAVFAKAYLFNADFTDAQLSGVNFAGAYLYGGSASVSGATMPGVDFAGAYLTSLDLSNVKGKNLAGAVFDGACLVNCNFRGTKIEPDTSGKGASFVAACLQGADFSQATLSGATMVDAGIAPPCPEPGTCRFPATLRFGDMHVKIEITILAAGTILPPNATSSATVCPNRQHGPCTDNKLTSPHAPKSWPVGFSRGDERAPPLVESV